MKIFATIALTSILLVSAAAADDKKSSHPQTITIPAGAVEAGPSTWKYTDSEGKKWIYRKTPFGVVRVEDVPEAEKPATAGAEERTSRWKVKDEGEKVSFENPSPFGPQRWTKKKSELNDDERAALARSQRTNKTAKPEGKN